MYGIEKRRWLLGGAALLSVVLAGCATRTGPAPVEDRGTMRRSAPSASAPLPTRDANGNPLPGIENLGKPGYYAVQPGDTIRRIASLHGRDWRELVQWNDLQNPDRIEIGQVVRVVPPTATAATAAASAPAPVPPAGANGQVGGEARPASPATSSVARPASASGDEDVNWMWPAQGSLLAGFDEAKNKGYDIGGKAGDPVVAAADGQVVYAGAGLRGYGNLIILKHNNTYLTAYAHNQSLLVKEDQRVRRGQKIAEMGNSDADRVKLHFEVRRQGKPVDPSRYLPSR